MTTRTERGFRFLTAGAIHTSLAFRCEILFCRFLRGNRLFSAAASILSFAEWQVCCTNIATALPVLRKRRILCVAVRFLLFCKPSPVGKVDCRKARRMRCPPFSRYKFRAPHPPRSSALDVLLAKLDGCLQPCSPQGKALVRSEHTAMPRGF